MQLLLRVDVEQVAVGAAGAPVGGGAAEAAVAELRLLALDDDLLDERQRPLLRRLDLAGAYDRSSFSSRS
jgi:hypothetical protein